MHELHQRRRQQALGEIAAPIPVGRLAQIDAREMQQIETVEDHRRVLVGGRDLPLGLQLGAILERREGRLAARVERHDLAVEDHAVHGLLAELRREPRKLAGQLESAPRAQLDPVLVDEGEHPIAVELGLPHPVRVVERGVARFGEHRRELGRHRFDLARGNEPRGGHLAHRDDLEILDRHAGEHRAILRGDIVGAPRTGPCA